MAFCLAVRCAFLAILANLAQTVLRTPPEDREEKNTEPALHRSRHILVSEAGFAVGHIVKELDLVNVLDFAFPAFRTLADDGHGKG